MKIIFLLLLFIPILCFAEEYSYDKKCNPEILLEELQQAGIDLEGEDQIGSLNISGNNIKVIIKDGQSVDKNNLDITISNHQYKTEDEVKQEKDNKKKQQEQSIKTKLGLSDKEFIDLKNVLRD